MPKIICNTSPLQYLHQLDQLSLLKSLAGRITVPTAVENEITIGIEWGVDLPDLRKLDWLDFQTPLSSTAAPLVRDLGPGETQSNDACNGVIRLCCHP